MKMLQKGMGRALTGRRWLPVKMLQKGMGPALTGRRWWVSSDKSKYQLLSVPTTYCWAGP